MTAGHQSARAKDNLQLLKSALLARQVGDQIVAALQRYPLLVSAALSLRVFPPLFNRYEGGPTRSGLHLDQRPKTND